MMLSGSQACSTFGRCAIACRRTKACSDTKSNLVTPAIRCVSAETSERSAHPGQVEIASTAFHSASVSNPTQDFLQTVVLLSVHASSCTIRVYDGCFNREPSDSVLVPHGTEFRRVPQARPETHTRKEKRTIWPCAICVAFPSIDLPLFSLGFTHEFTGSATQDTAFNF